MGTQPAHRTSRHRFINVFNQSCCAKHLSQLSLLLPVATMPPLACRITHMRDRLLNQIMEPIKTKTSCAWGKSEGQPQPRSVPNTLHVQQDSTNGRAVLAGSAHESTSCNTSLLMIYQFGSPLKDPNDQGNLSSVDVVLCSIKCCKTGVNIPSEFRNNQAKICNRIA